MASLIWFRVVGAGAIGLLAWRGQLWAIPLSIVVPCLIAVQPTRSTAGATSFAYYAAASLPVIGVAKAYWPSSEASAVFMWMAAAALLSVPWFFCWTRLESLRPWTAAIAVALTAVPPLCIIGWASPLLSAGVLFPNSALVRHCRRFGTPRFVDPQEDQAGRTGSRQRGQHLLEHSREGSEETNRLGRRDDPDPPATESRRPCRFCHRGATAARRSSLQRAKVLVFPEGAVRRWTDATDAFWAPAVVGCWQDDIDRCRRANPRLCSLLQLRGHRRRPRPVPLSISEFLFPVGCGIRSNRRAEWR